LRAQRLNIILKILQGRPINLIIDETGDKKKGKKTDYVKRQYIGNLGKIENGIVAVTAYGLFKGITFPLAFKIYKPSERLLSGDVYKSKPIIAAEMIRELTAMGFNFSLVLADSLYGLGSTRCNCNLKYRMSLRFRIQNCATQTYIRLIIFRINTY
jgi:SRSO17 transposase